MKNWLKKTTALSVAIGVLTGAFLGAKRSEAIVVTAPDVVLAVTTQGAAIVAAEETAAAAIIAAEEAGSAAVVGAVASVDATLVAMQAYLVQVISETGGRIEGASKMQTKALQDLAQLQSEWDRINKVRDETLKVAKQRSRALDADACAITTLGMYGGSISAGTQAMGTVNVRMLSDFAKGETNASSRGSTAAVQSAVDEYCRISGTAQDVRIGRCKATVMGGQPAVNAASIGEHLLSDTAMSPEQQAAAKAYLAMQAKPLADFPAQAARSELGRQQANKAIDLEMKRSTALKYLAESDAKRDPSIVPAEAKTVVTSVAKTMSSYQSNGANPFPNGVSWMDYFAVYSKKWVEDPAVNIAMQGNAVSGEGGGSKDIFPVLAVMAMQNYEIYRKLDQMTAILATQLNIEVERRAEEQGLSRK